MIHSRDITVIVQGPVYKSLTAQVLRQVREVFPAAQIIFSSWESSNLIGLKYDQVVLAADPGAPEYPPPLNGKYNNTNRQLSGVQAALPYVQRPYLLRLRSDMLIAHDRWLRFFGHFQSHCANLRIFEQRVLTCSIFSRPFGPDSPALFSPSDWCHFGTRSDVMKLWNAPLASEPENTCWFVNHPRPVPDRNPSAMFRYQPEQVLWLGCLSDYAIELADHQHWTLELAVQSRDSILNNFVVLHPWQLGIMIPKYRREVYLRTDWHTLYTYQQWLKDYRQHCGGQERDPSCWIERTYETMMLTRSDLIGYLNKRWLRRSRN
jgi:hypothetical protein